ncbi:MAG TPA: oxidoreductase [Cyanobacteria bacterium UBA8803]|nr:oxidoreductase [Cyanobacteria bacterium UBA9273]HBL58118.1 oxidoreductase [Cyanobacteria bacterium UBA8803]
MKTRIAILGAGRWGTHLVRNFGEHPDADLVAVVDPHSERLAALRERLNLKADVIWATAWEEVRTSTEIDAVVIATPAVTHYPLIQDALERGYHVLAEKPLTLKVAECLELCRLAQQQQRQLMVDHTYLFHPAVIRGKTVVQSGCLGELRYGYATRTNLGPVRQDVDALWDLAIHDIAIFNTWLEQLPIQVQAIGKVWLNRNGKNQETRPQKDNEELSNSSLFTSQGLADFVQVTLTYPTGFSALIHLCWLNPDKQRRLGVVGSRGTLIFDEMQNDAPLILQHGYFEQNGDSFNPVDQRREVLDIEPAEPLKLVCDRFLDSLQCTPSELVSSAWVGAQLVQILSCLSQSLKQGGHPVPVPLLPILSD